MTDPDMYFPETTCRLPESTVAVGDAVMWRGLIYRVTQLFDDHMLIGRDANSTSPVPVRMFYLP